MKQNLFRGLFVASLMAANAPAMAKDATLEMLAQKGIITADEYAALKTDQKDQASISLRDGFRVSSNDGKSMVQISTLLQLDAAHFETSGKDAPDGTELRRARLAFGGNSGLWEYRLEGEFAGTVAVTDAYAAWRGPLTVTAGNFKLPYSLESLMSDKSLSFMERSLSSAFLPSRAPGLMLSDGRENGGWAIGVFGEPLSTSTPPTISGSTSTAAADDEGGGVSARSTWAPLIGDGHVVHLGGSLHYRVPTQGGVGANDTLRISSKPEANQFVNKLVNTGNIAGDVSSYELGALELASAWGAVLFQSEYTQAKVRRDKAADAELEGGYAQIGWVLTGERRSYKGDKGIFDGIKPTGTVAWEVALRASQLDLTDVDIKGGRERNAAVALNAYVGPAVKISINYVDVLEVKGGSFAGDEPTAYMLRAQFAY